MGRPKPIWRCEQCSYWTPRTGKDTDRRSCPFCSAGRTATDSRIRRVPLWAAYRAEPDPVPASAWDLL